jgi:hypothetical protein
MGRGLRREVKYSPVILSLDVAQGGRRYIAPFERYVDLLFHLGLKCAAAQWLEVFLSLTGSSIAMQVGYSENFWKRNWHGGSTNYCGRRGLSYLYVIASRSRVRQILEVTRNHPHQVRTRSNERNQSLIQRGAAPTGTSF